MLFLLGMLSFALMSIFYWSLSSIGFPDGHRTELDRMYEKIYPIYMVISGLFAALFFYLAWHSDREQNQKKTIWAFFFLSLFIVLAILLDGSFHHLLEHGQGG
ncbi:MAG: hypothetical protein ACPGXL_10305 [Chitinophagales bacterium]